MNTTGPGIQMVAGGWFSNEEPDYVDDCAVGVERTDKDEVALFVRIFDDPKAGGTVYFTAEMAFYLSNLLAEAYSQQWTRDEVADD